MTDTKMSVREGPYYLKEKIIKFGVQSLAHHRSDSNLAEHVHDAVAGLEWVQTVITQCAAADVPLNI